MKGILTLKKSAVKSVSDCIDKFLHNGKYVKIYENNTGYSYISAASIFSIHIYTKLEIKYNFSDTYSSREYDVNKYHISLDKECNLIVQHKTRLKTKKEIEAARKKEQLEERTNLLFSAARNNNLEQAKVCIELGADMNAKSKIKDDNGRTALMIASYQGNKDVAELLIKSGANVNAMDNSGSTALMCAIYTYRHDLTRYDLIGYDLIVKDKIKKDKIEKDKIENDKCKDIAELLIKSGADVNAIDNAGRTALVWAIIKGKKDMTELLIKEGADSGAALIGAVKSNEFDATSTARILIEVGADVNAKDSEGVSVLKYAILYEKKDIEKLLRAAGATE